MQDLSEVEIDLAGNPASTRLSSLGGHLPTLIGAKSLRQFAGLHQDLKKAAIGFYAAELMLKITADEHPNPAAYDLLTEFLASLDKLSDPNLYDSLLDSFCLSILETMGFKVPSHLKAVDHKSINKFIEYILERNLKSELFMKHVTYNT